MELSMTMERTINKNQVVVQEKTKFKMKLKVWEIPGQARDDKGKGGWIIDVYKTRKSNKGK